MSISDDFDKFMTGLIIIGCMLFGGALGYGIRCAMDRAEAKTAANIQLGKVMPAINFVVAPDGKPLSVNSYWSFFAADYDGDGIADLWIIKRANTGTHSTEVHILKGPDFQTFIQHCGTPLEETPDNIQVKVQKAEKE